MTEEDTFNKLRKPSFEQLRIMCHEHWYEVLLKNLLDGKTRDQAYEDFIRSKNWEPNEFYNTFR